MKLRLKEDPREWRKFGLSSSLVLALIVGFLCWRRMLPGEGAVPVLALLLVTAVLALVRPAWFRQPYRAGMRLSHLLGRIMAPVILGLIFFLLLTPIGLVLRCLGKDLLGLRRRPSTTSYWQPASGSGDLNKMF